MVVPSPRVAHSNSSSPDFILFTDAEGSGGCAALVFQTRNEARWVTLLETKVPLEAQPLAKGTHLIFPFESYAVAEALWSLGDAFRGPRLCYTSLMTPRLKCSPKWGSKHSSVSRPEGAFCFPLARNSLNIWLERVSRVGNPADAPMGERLTPVEISSQRTLPPSRRIRELAPPPHLGLCSRRGNSPKIKTLPPRIFSTEMNWLVREAPDCVRGRIARDTPARRRLTYGLLEQGNLDNFLPRFRLDRAPPPDRPHTPLVADGNTPQLPAVAPPEEVETHFDGGDLVGSIAVIRLSLVSRGGYSTGLIGSMMPLLIGAAIGPVNEMLHAPWRSSLRRICVAARRV